MWDHGRLVSGEIGDAERRGADRALSVGIMKQRHRLERLEGTTYDAMDVEVSFPWP